jgi:membrane protein YqaA with SNARE-associated domain
VDNPRRNNWYLQGTGPPNNGGQVASNFQVTPEIATAAALVAEADANKSPVNGTATASAANCQGGAGGFWMEKIARKGKWPFNSDSNFQVINQCH